MDCIVYFLIDYKTKFGENLFICGSNEQIGNWEANNGLIFFFFC